MTSYYERKCLYHAARSIEPFGQIIDLGSWLGSLTASLAAGLMVNPRLADSSIRIHAYDTFVWSSWMEPMGKRHGIRGYSEGESFLPEFRRLMRKWESLIEVHAGDVADFPWTGEPVSILVIDAMKDEGTARFIMTNFFPSLVAGRSLVFQQDFAHFYTSWIHLIWYRIRDNLELIEDLPESGGSMYRYSKTIPRESYAAILDFASATDEEWSLAFANSRSIVRADKIHAIAAAEVMRLLHARRGDDAVATALRHKENGSWGGEMERVIQTPEWQHLAAAKWSRLGSSRTPGGE
jgi:hypothetical protein